MKIRRAPLVRIRPDKFGGIVYVPLRDDFFVVDRRVYSFTESLSTTQWSEIAPDLRDAGRRLAGLQICETDPPTPIEAYSGPSFIGQFEEIVTLEQPLVLNCFSTAHCPLRCVYCHADDLMSPRARESERSSEEGLRNVLAVARRVPSIVAVITGGDPLTRPDRTRNLIEALSAEKALVLDTSGVAEPRTLEQLLPIFSKHRVHVRVSLDFANPKLQEKLRPINVAYAKGLSSFDSPLTLLSECIALGIPVTVQSVISNQNDRPDILFRLRDFLLEMGVHHWVLHMAVEAGLARKIEARHRAARRARGILPRPDSMRSVWKVIKSSIESRQPIDIRVTDNSNTPNSVLLVGADGSLYTEGLAHHGKVKLFDPEDGKPDQIERLFYYIDRFGHARRYLNWNPEMFDGEDLNKCCIEIKLPLAEKETGIVERERKFRIADCTVVRRSLKQLDFTEVESSVIDDTYYDTPDRSLEPNDFAIRTRAIDGKVRLALKGPRFWKTSGEHDRIELELESLSGPEIEKQLERKGFMAVWQLRRRRTTFRKRDVDVEIVIDELPVIGDCLEMEGDVEALADLSKSVDGLGVQETKNYKELIEDWCSKNGEDFSRVFGLTENGLLKRI
jgi:predicted adenylyl cyclase CyaB